MPSYGQRTGRMVALARNLDLFWSRILAGWTAVSFARLHRALAWQVRTLSLLNRRHFSFSLSNLYLLELLSEAAESVLWDRCRRLHELLRNRLH